jgi:hypothetical protein
MYPKTLPALAALVAPAILFSAPAHAQADATAAATALVDVLAPGASERQLLDKQLADMRSGATIRQMFAGNPRFKAEAAKNQPAFNQAIARMGAMQADAVGPIMREMLPATRSATIAAYARAFTPAELNQLTAFFKSPAGAKFMRVQPQIQAEVGKQMQTRFGPRLEAAQKSVGPKLEAELKKLFPQQ